MRYTCSVCGVATPRNFPPPVPGDQPLCPSCFAAQRGFCMLCNEPGDRVIEHMRVQGYFVAGRYASKTLCVCRRCARKTAMGSILWNVFWGWWGIMIFAKAVQAQVMNLRALWSESDFPKPLFPFAVLLAFSLPLAVAVLAAVLLLPAAGGRDSRRIEEASAAAAEGKAHLAEGRLEAAAAKFFEAAEADPENPAYRFEHGFVLFKLGKLDRAEEEMKKGMAVRPGKAPREAMILAEIEEGLGKLEEASKYYRMAIDETGPDMEAGLSAAKLRDFLCRAHRGYQDARRERKPEGLIEEYRSIAEANPESALFAYLLARIETGFPRREDLFRKSMSLDPEFFEPAYALAYLYFEEGMAGKALESAAFAAGRWGKRPQTLALIAGIHAEAGAFGESAAAYAGLSALKDCAARGEAGLASLLAMQGRFAEAEERLSGIISGIDRGYWRDFANLWLGIAVLCQGKDAAEPLSRAMASRTKPVAEKAALWLGAFRLRKGADPMGVWGPAARGASESFEGLTLGMVAGLKTVEEYDKAMEAGRFASRRAEARYFRALRLRSEGRAAEAAAMEKAAREDAGAASIIGGMR